MAFRFRLEKVAQFRQKLVDEQGRRVAEANRAVVALQARIAAVDEDLSEHLKDFSDANDAVVSVQGMMARTMWVSHLDEMRAEFSRGLQAAQAELAQQRTSLNEVWRDLEVLNKLREKQKAAWLADELKRENQDLDEVGQIRADRQRRSKVAS
ncbi:MAG: flagellar export protein FliJ [Candidatus Krumholzibacteria bacterium]|nr:flagellar export protein FliJ [Candidatus Krumholzibacteria bacterium]